MGSFYKKKGMARVLLVKEKKGFFLGQVIFFFGGEMEWQGLNHTDYLTGIGQEIPD